MQKGFFIAIEGLDGSGQSTQVSLLAEYLKRKGFSVHVTKEPTNNIIGGLIRGQLTNDWKTGMECFQLLFAADRAHHLEKEVLPAVEKGTVVITDRYKYSSIAYGGIDTDMEWLKKINERFPEADVTIYLKVPPKVCLQRMKSSRLSLELFEEEKKLERVAANYEKLSKEFKNFVVIDGNRTVEEVHEDVAKAVDGRLVKK